MSPPRRSASRFGHARRPADDAILEVFVFDFVFASADAAAHRNARLVHGLRIAGNQRMPPVQIAPFGEQTIGTGGRQPNNAPDIARGEPDAVLHLRGTIGIVATAAACPIEQSAANIREIGPARIVGILELDQAAAAAAVAQALLLGIAHLGERLRFPERRAVGHQSLRTPALRASPEPTQRGRRPRLALVERI